MLLWERKENEGKRRENAGKWPRKRGTFSEGEEEKCELSLSGVKQEREREVLGFGQCLVGGEVRESGREKLQGKVCA